MITAAMEPAMTHDFSNTVRSIDRQAQTLILIEARFAEAARTLRLVPSADSRFLARVRAKWPDFAPETFDRWVGYNRERARYAKLKPTAKQIDRMDECLFVWLPWLLPDQIGDGDAPADVAHIVWARANRFSWRAIGRMRRSLGQESGGNSHVSLRIIYRRGIATIARRLDDQGRTLTIPDDWEAR